MYVQGFLVPVATAAQADYRDLATRVAPLFAEYGAHRIVEAWGVDVPDGTRTDMKRAVAAGEGETVVYSWIDWPDKATCDAAAARMMADERMPTDQPIPFDGKRMVFGGFETVMDRGEAGTPGFVDGMVAAVPVANRAAYLDHAAAAAPVFLEHGATRLVENWGVDLPDGTVTDFRRAVQAEADETVVFSWIEWPDNPTRDAGMGAVMADPRLRDMAMPFDGKRMIYGGFAPMLDTDGKG